MNRDDALALIKEKVPNENLQRHMMAVGAIMARLARHFGETEETWELAGILHDIDLGVTDDPEQHGRIGAAWLTDMAMDPDISHAVLVHAGHAVERSRLDTALIAADQISGLIIACALVKGRSLNAVTPKTIRKRFKEKRFAAGADRDAIRKCETIGLTLDTFYGLALEAMQDIADDLGLP